MGDLLRAACGGALVATLALTWASSGSGSLLSGHDLAGFLASHGETAAAVGIYLTAAAGCGVILTAPWPSRVARWLRAATGIALCVSLLGVGATGALPFGRWGWAPTVACAASLAVAILELACPERR